MLFGTKLREVLNSLNEACDSVKESYKSAMATESELLVMKGFTKVYLNSGFIMIDPEISIPLDFALDPDSVTKEDSKVIGYFFQNVENNKYIIFVDLYD